MFLLLVACGGNEPVVTATPEPTTTSAPVEESEAPTETEPVEVNTGFVNPLTGEPTEKDISQLRPIAIMLNNIKKALPQQGVSQADIIYEVPAEGGITRMLGVFQSVEDVGEIGSVRSARPYYVALAQGLDAVLLHAGGSTDAYNYIAENGITALDCVNGPYEGSLFWRDKTRISKMGMEHSVLTSGAVITELFEGYTFRKEHEEGYTYAQTFAEDGTPVGGDSALTVTVPFSGYKTGVFRYDEASNAYLVEEYGSAYVDGNNGEQVSVTNVLILQTTTKVLDSVGRLSVDLSSGSGWFACGGKVIPILWSKGAGSNPLTYTTEDGAPLVLGQGKSYVNIISKEYTPSFE
jgi:hypothetical protein